MRRDLEQLRRAEAGFSLVELAVAVALIGVVSVLAVRMFSRGDRGAIGGAFARAVLAQAHQARDTALAVHRQTRLRIVPPAGGVAGAVITEIEGATDGGVALSAVYVPLGTTPVVKAIDMCDIKLGAQLPTSGFPPPCPFSIGQVIVNFGPDGRVTATTAAGANGPGASLYFRTVDGAQHYKLVLFPLTGLPRLVDAW